MRGARYANGQFVGEQMGIEGFWHSGGWLGTSTYYGRPVKGDISCHDV